MRQRTWSKMDFLRAVLLVAAFAGAATHVSADTPTCVTGMSFNNTAGEHFVRIHSRSLDGYTADQVSAAIKAAAEIWNHEGNSGTFKFIGASALDDIPLYQSHALLADCTDQSINYSLIVVEPPGSSDGQAFAKTWPRCYDSQGRGNKFLIRIYPDSDTATWDWSHGAWQTGAQADITAVMAHEFGHGLGLGHSSEGTPRVHATMRSVPANPGTFARDLFRHDLECSSSLAGERALKMAKRIQSSNGSFTSTSSNLLPSGQFVVKGDVARWYGPTNWVDGVAVVQSEPSACLAVGTLSAVQLNSECVYSTESTHLSPWLVPDPDLHGSPAVSDNDRVRVGWFRTITDADNPALTANHEARDILSTDGFATTWAVNSTRQCSSMTGSFLACTGTPRVDMASARRLTSTWDRRNSRTVFAWTHQARPPNDDLYDFSFEDTSGVASREVRIAVGIAEDRSLPVHDLVPLTGSVARSDAAPGVACGPAGAAGGTYDCVVVWSENSDLLSSVKTKRFRATAGSSRYTLSFDSSTGSPSGVRSSADIAAWWHQPTGGTAKFYFAVRPHGDASQQQIQLYESTDGLSWSVSDTGFGISSVGPVVTSHTTNVDRTLLFFYP